MQKKERNTNLECLRIISMLMIVADHYSIHGFGEMPYSLNRYIVGVLSLGGELGVVCFVLISGYYMVYSRFTLYKLVKLVAEVWFYSVVFGGVLFLTVLHPVEPLGIISLVKMLVPVGYGEYWFMTDYILLMLLSPVLNRVILHAERSSYRNMMVLFFALWYVIPFFTRAGYDMNSLAWFVYLYFVAGYVRRFMEPASGRAGRHMAVAAASCLLIILSCIVMIYVGHRWSINFLIAKSIHFGTIYSPFVLLAAVEFLIGFAKRRPFSNRAINRLAGTTLGIYLIHDNNTVRPYLWKALLKNQAFYDTNYLLLHAVCSIVGVFLVCSMIDLLRQVTIEKMFLRVVDRHLQGIEDRFSHMYDRLLNWGHRMIEWYYGR